VSSKAFFSCAASYIDLYNRQKTEKQKTITINKFFVDNKELLLGDIVPGGMYSEKTIRLVDPNNKMGQIGKISSK
jgi:hypothetical protein